MPITNPPGKSWRYRGKGPRLQLRQSPPPVSGPPLTPLHGPVQARQPLPARGRIYRNAGVLNQAGVPLGPLSGPAGVRVTQQRAGSAQASVVTPTAAAPASGPPLTPLHSPVQARYVLPSRGRISGRAGIFDQLGPALTPLRKPVAAAARPLPARGRNAGSKGVYAQLGPAYVQQRRALQARYILPPKGRTAGRAGVFAQLGPPLYPLRRPVTAAVRTLPPRGIVRAMGPLAVSFPGPPLTPLHGPVRARYVLPSRGRTAGSQGKAVSLAPQAGPPVYPLQGPVRARYSLPPRGRTYGSKGVRAQAGPPLTPLRKPVTAASRLLPQRGVCRAMGPLQFTLPVQQLTPLHGPVRAVFTPGRKGYAQGRRGVSVTVGPPVKPLSQPVRAAYRTLPPKGRTYHTPPYVAPFVPVHGPAIYPLRHPVTARPPLPPHGRVYTTPRHAAVITGTGWPYKAELSPGPRWAAVVNDPIPVPEESVGGGG